MSIDARTEEYVKKLKFAKHKCLAGSLFFTRYFYKKRYKRKFVVSQHHEIISSALDRVLKGELKRLIINIAPRYSKTEIAVKNFIANGLAINPAAKFIHLTYSDSLAKDNSEEIKDMVQDESYREMFPDVIIKKDSRAKNKWYTTAGGGVYAAAAGGQVTGFGAGAVDEEEEEISLEDEALEDEALRELEEFLSEYDNDYEKKLKFGGAIVIDDPIKPEDAASDNKRERVNNRFDTTIRNRVNSRNTPIIVIGQRVHPDDLSGYLIDIEPGEWEVISLPCLYLDEEGEMQALWPFKHTVEELQKLKKVNDIVFETQYQQNAEPKEGLLFHRNELHYYNPETVDVEKLAEFRFATIDPADEGGDDLSAPFGYLIGNKIYITDCIYNNYGTDINESACVLAMTSKKLHAARIEGNSAWVLFAKAVRNKVQEKNPDCQIRVIKNTQNKHTRILAESSFIRNNFVFRSDWENLPEYSKFMKVLTKYLRVGKSNKDDAPDSLAMMSTYFQTQFPHLW